MKIQIVIRDEYCPIIVSDEKHTDKNAICWNGKEIFSFMKEYSLDYADRYWQKVIAGLPELPQIDWNGLEDEFGYVDVEKLVKEEQSKHYPGSELIVKTSFLNGFKATQQLNDKKFSLQDLREAIAEAWNSCEDNEDGETFTQCFNRIIQSLQPKKVFDIEVEMERETLYTDDGLDYKGDLKPKITNNKIKILWV